MAALRYGTSAMASVWRYSREVNNSLWLLMSIWLTCFALEYDWLFRVLRILSLICYKALFFFPRWKMCRDLWLPLSETAQERVSLCWLWIILMDIILLIFWLMCFLFVFGRFVISVGWDRRIDIYLVSIKWPACFPRDLILYQRNSPDGSNKMVDCRDLFLPPGTLAFIAVNSISIFHLLEFSSLLKSAVRCGLFRRSLLTVNYSIYCKSFCSL